MVPAGPAPRTDRTLLPGRKEAMTPQFYDILKKNLKDSGLSEWARKVMVMDAASSPEFLKVVEKSWSEYRKIILGERNA